MLQKIKLLLEGYGQLIDYISDDLKQYINFDFLGFHLYSCRNQHKGAELHGSFPGEIPEQHPG